MRDPLIQPGSVWRDLDPRGGPTFRIVSAHPGMNPPHAIVEGLDGKRRRRVLLARFRDSDQYRSGYTLVERGEDRAQ